MSVPVHVTPEARDDIRSGKQYYDRKRPGLGSVFVDEILDLLTRIGDMPLGFGEVGFGARAVGVRRFGYVVYYRTDSSFVEVLAVLHGARSPDVWQRRAEQS